MLTDESLELLLEAECKMKVPHLKKEYHKE